jgi:hypothetical protein
MFLVDWRGGAGGPPTATTYRRLGEVEVQRVVVGLNSTAATSNSTIYAQRKRISLDNLRNRSNMWQKVVESGL